MKHLKKVCISGQADNTNNCPLTKSDATMRLQQAAHILVTGAIRAAQKHKSDAKDRAENPIKSATFPTSEYHTLGEIDCKSVPEFPTKGRVSGHISDVRLKEGG
ncbi:MAG: hypothetical protein ABI210_01915 [Abditibacteriaceae bacterium]